MKKKLLVTGGMLLISAFSLLGCSRTANQEKEKPTIKVSKQINSEKIKSEKSKNNKRKDKKVTSIAKDEVVTDGPMRFRGLKKENWDLTPPRFIDSKESTTSNLKLANVIKESMKPLNRTNNVKWNVAVLDLNKPNVNAEVTNWSFANNSNLHRQFSASTIKLFILLKFEQLIHEKGINPAKEIYHLKKSDIVSGSGYIYNHQNETDYSYAQLRDLMITDSDNIATNVLIDYVGGPPAVNKLISEILGPNHESVLERKMMDDWKIDVYHRANRINAKEVVETLEKVYHRKLKFLTDEARAHIFELMSQTKNRTKIPSQIKSFDVFNKTGESAYRGVENDLAIIKSKNSNQAFAICVLTEVQGEDILDISEAPFDTTTTEVETIGNIARDVSNWMRDSGYIG